MAQSDPKAFLNDVFISYAHKDNASRYEDQPGWVDAFQRALETRLQQLQRPGPSIWRDKEKLRGTEKFRDRLERELAEVCVLVSVLSPNYVVSDSCRDELRTFFKLAEEAGTLLLEGRSRAVKVIKTRFDATTVADPADRDLISRFVSELLGFEFVREDKTAAQGYRELEPAFKEYRLEFDQKVDDLAHEVTEILKLSRGAGREARPAVFLAETTEDLTPAREELRRDLQRNGYRVLPHPWQLPRQAGKLRDYVREQLARCRLSVHPVGKARGFIPEGVKEPVVDLQIELARRHVPEDGSDFARLIWIPEDLDSEDVEQEQREWIRELRENPGLREGADLIERPIEELKTAMHRKLAELERKRATVYVASTSLELRKERGAIAEDLAARGYTVLPSREPSLLASELEERARKDLAQCQLSVHLAGVEYGVVPEGTDRSTARLQWELARDLGAPPAGPRRLIVLPPGVRGADARQQALLEELRGDRGGEILELRFEEIDALRGAVAERAAAVERDLARPAEPAVAPGEVTRVYVISDQRDEGNEQLEQLEQLLEAEDIELLRPAFDAADEQEARQLHESNLDLCRGVLVYHGAASTAWLTSKQNDLRQRTGKPPATRAILLAPPTNSSKSKFKTREAVVLDGTSGIEPPILAPFLTALRQGGAQPTV